MSKTARIGCFVFALALTLAVSVGGGEAQETVAPDRGLTLAGAYSPVSASQVIGEFGGASGAEVRMSSPQSHKIQFLKGGAARVAIWDGTRYLPRVFTAVESWDGSRVCLARTRGWTGGCLTIKSNGRDLRCRYMWNNGATGETGCRVDPIRKG